MIIIPLDKSQHYIHGTILGIIGMLAAVALGFKHPELYGFLLAAIAGVVKEGVDWLANKASAREGAAPQHGVELMDFVATALGGVIAPLAVFISRQ